MDTEMKSKEAFQEWWRINTPNPPFYPDPVEFDEDDPIHESLRQAFVAGYEAGRVDAVRAPQL